MKIAILGGGFTGLTTSYQLAKKGHAVTIFEKEKVLGGLASGFKQKNWDWYLERAYHHLFANDYDILNFAEEVGFEKIIFNSPETASLYETGKIDSIFSSYKIFPLDSPQDLLYFPLLSLPQRIRTGVILLFLKLSPFFSLYEKQTAQKFLQKYMGDEAWNVLWQELFRKKFGKYAENILASFIWARIKKRTKSLGYTEGGFQALINHLHKQLKRLRVNALTSCEVKQTEKSRDRLNIYYRQNNEKIVQATFDTVISTLPTTVMAKITQGLLPVNYLARFKKLKYLHAVNLILETKQPLLEKTYWLNICVSKLPLMALVQHTNFMDKKNYGGNHIAYVGWYVDKNNKLLKMNLEQITDYIAPYLKKINPSFHVPRSTFYKFVGPFAQPIFDRDFVKNKPDFITPVKNFFIANLDMTYPYDRGTNYAVKLGKEVAGMI